MAKNNIHGMKYYTVLSLSVLINCLLIYNHVVHQQEEECGGLSWSKEASIEAEAVAAISCSGHGRAYLDGVLSDEEEPACECNSGYGGKYCSLFLPDSPADADSGDPLFLEPFWMQNAASSAVMVAGWHRMSYRFGDHSAISEELEKYIRKLHAVVGNAVTDGRFIVFGAGSIQLLNAAILALSPENSSSPTANIVATAPFYPLYKAQAEFFKYVEYRWKGEASLWKNKSESDSSGTFIEFVTSPNNPDCKLKKPVLQGPSSKAIFDHAYYWPHFSAIPSAADEDLMIFTLSKLTGHAGSRFGWALIKDEKLYNRMASYISLNTMSVSKDVQLRALKLLKAVVRDNGRALFGFGSKTMMSRWARLSKVLLSSTRFSLQKLDSQYCTYFQNVTGPSPAYAWVKCEKEDDQDCDAVLQAAGIIGRGGSIFGDDSRYVRLSLIKSEDDFNLLLRKLDALVSREGGVQHI